MYISKPSTRPSRHFCAADAPIVVNSYAPNRFDLNYTHTFNKNRFYANVLNKIQPRNISVTGRWGFIFSAVAQVANDRKFSELRYPHTNCKNVHFLRAGSLTPIKKDGADIMQSVGMGRHLKSRRISLRYSDTCNNDLLYTTELRIIDP